MPKTARFLLALAVLALLAAPALALAPEEQPLEDPALEARVHAIARTIRCLVCQNQSIEDSNADLATDLRMIVRERVAAGASDDEVRQFLVDRYGDWILLEPPFAAKTWALWFAPLLVMSLGAFGVILYFRHSRADAAGLDEGLSAEEQARLRAVLDGGGIEPGRGPGRGRDKARDGSGE